ncbi:hypothetical protein UFOVP518_19 [uncultured Caudovirales phage]|uniref:Uncharacterized protein n=1 Tax=uncultured Caudovirales phage TaxID=2100421 RepID=A0A6J5MNS5_9CAUD|nr:hypothetical protein UFOVP518_19 [uncultured Caudovirales phage]
MALTYTPPFPQKMKLAQVTITAVTTDKTGATTTNIKDLYTATTDGTKVTQIGFKMQGTSVAGLFLIWITETDGTTYHLFDEIVIAAATSSTTVATSRIVNSYSDLQLASGQKIKVGFTTISGSINCDAFCQIADFS